MLTARKLPPARILHVSNLNQAQQAAQDDARQHGRFGEQAKAAPGQDVIAEAATPMLLCGKCGAAMTDKDGCFVDEYEDDRCSDDTHTVHTYDACSITELKAGDRAMLWGDKIIVDSVSEKDDFGFVVLGYLSTEPNDNHSYSCDIRHDELLDVLTSAPLRPQTKLPAGPDPEDFTDDAMVRYERALDGASPAGDGDEVRKLSAQVNLMRARRLADLVAADYPLASRVVLECDPDTNSLRVGSIVLANGDDRHRFAMLNTHGPAFMKAIDAEAARLDETGDNDWIRTCSMSRRGYSHEMVVAEARRIDALDLDNGTYSPTRFDRL